MKEELLKFINENSNPEELIEYIYLIKMLNKKLVGIKDFQ